MKKLYILLIVVLTYSLHSQNVAISTTTAAPNASAMLDITSTSKGLLIPRMTAAQRAAIASPATALMVYQTDAGTQGAGFYFYNGAAWVAWSTQGAGWGLTGNNGTSAASNYIGTADAIDFITKTNGTERMRIFSNGQIAINSSTLNTYSTLFTTASGTNMAIEGYASSGNSAILGSNSGSGDGIRGSCVGASSAGLYGVATGSAAAGVYGYNNGGSNGYGVFGTSYLGAASGIGVYGDTDGPTGFGTSTKNSNGSGTGLLAVGNNQTGSFLAGGSGGAFTGSTTGLVSYGKSGVSTGVVGAGNNQTPTTFSLGSGGAFTGFNYGVYANAVITGAVNDATNRAAFVGNYTPGASTISTVYVGARIGGTAYKILGAGVVSTIMNTREGEKILFAPEATEPWFFDMGEVQLVNGKATVALDPVFLDCLADSKPFKVFVQGGENTIGSIRVTRNQKEKSFVLEDMGGKSNGIVQYSIYGVWKGNENKRMPEFKPEYHIKPFAPETKEVDNSSAEKMKTNRK